MSRGRGPTLTEAGAVTWLLLDVGGVLELVDDDRWPGEWASRWATRRGMTLADFSGRLADADLPDLTRRSGVQDVYWATVGAALNASSVEVDAMRSEFWDGYCGRANDELLAFFTELYGSVGLAILSNSADGAREEEERRFGFSAVFDPILYSHEIGVGKPDRAAFEIALDRLAAHPRDVLFVDNVPMNVDAAGEAGIRAHLHIDNRSTVAAVSRELT